MKNSKKTGLKTFAFSLIALVLALCTFLAFMPKKSVSATYNGGWVTGLDSSSPAPVSEDVEGIAGWTTRGTGNVTITDNGDKYTKISMKHNNAGDWGMGAYYNEAVPVDGLTLYFYTSNLGASKIGLGFTDDLNGYPPAAGNRLNIVYKANPDWNLAFYINNHDVDNVGGGRKFYAYKNVELTDKSYGINGEQFYGFKKTDKYGIKVKFSKVNSSVWKLDMSVLYGTDTETYQAKTTYVSNDCINGDNKYLTVWGMDADVDSFVRITYVKPGEQPKPDANSRDKMVWAYKDDTSNLTHLENFAYMMPDEGMGNFAYYGTPLTVDGLSVTMMIDNIKPGGVGFYCFAFAGTNEISSINGPKICNAKNRMVADLRPCWGDPNSPHSMLTFRLDNSPETEPIAWPDEDCLSDNTNLTKYYPGNQIVYDQKEVYVKDEIITTGEGKDIKQEVKPVYSEGKKIQITLTFNKCDNGNWKVSTVLDYGKYYHDEDKPEHDEQPDVCYIKGEYINPFIGSDGKAYLCVFGGGTETNKGDVFIGIDPDPNYNKYTPPSPIDPDPSPDPSDVVDPYYNYDENGDYIGSCFGGIGTGSLILSVSALAVAGIVVATRRKKEK